jgi:hypothetical protein
MQMTLEQTSTAVRRIDFAMPRAREDAPSRIDPENFYLIKRASKRDASSRDMALDLLTLRSTAEHMRRGIVRSAEINIRVRYRDSNLSKIDQSLWVYAKSNDFPELEVPPYLEMTEKPATYGVTPA